MMAAKRKNHYEVVRLLKAALSGELKTTGSNIISQLGHTILFSLHKSISQKICHMVST